MGIWSYLKGSAPAAPVDATHQAKVELAKQAPVKSFVTNCIDALEQSPRVTGLMELAEQQLPGTFSELSKTEKGRLFCAVREAKDRLEAEVKALNLGLEALSQLMLAQMEQEGEASFKLDTGELLSIQDEPYCSVENRDVWLNWVNSNGMQDLLSVNYQTMSAFVKDALRTGSNPPPGIKVFLKQSIRRYRARS